MERSAVAACTEMRGVFSITLTEIKKKLSQYSPGGAFTLWIRFQSTTCTGNQIFKRNCSYLSNNPKTNPNILTLALALTLTPKNNLYMFGSSPFLGVCMQKD